MGVAFVFAAAGFVVGAHLSIISYQVGLADYREHRVEKWQISMAHCDDDDGDTGKTIKYHHRQVMIIQFTPKCRSTTPWLLAFFFAPHGTQIYTHRSIKLDFFHIINKKKLS